MKILSNITWALFLLVAVGILVLWYRDYRDKRKRFKKAEILIRIVLIVLSSVLAVLSLVSTELAAVKTDIDLEAVLNALKSALPGILADFLFIDVPYLYMLFSRREKD